MSRVHPYLLTLVQGKRFQKVFRWPKSTKVYKPISAMPATTPARFTITGHGAPDGWPVRLTGVQGPQQINDRWLKAKVIDANTIEFNAFNARGLAAYVANTGDLEYFEPMDLGGFTGQVMLKESVTDAAAALEISTANGRLLLDNALKTITFDVDGATVAAMTKLGGVWDWEMTAAGVVHAPLGPQMLPPWKLVQEAVK